MFPTRQSGRVFHFHVRRVTDLTVTIMEAYFTIYKNVESLSVK